MAIVTPTDRPVGPQSLCNRSFWWRFCVVTLLFGFFCWCRGFCHRNESDLFLYLLGWNELRNEVSWFMVTKNVFSSVFAFTFWCCTSIWWEHLIFHCLNESFGVSVSVSVEQRWYILSNKRNAPVNIFLSYLK